jgi:N-hydroxyarylamine O-acetyltransferase
LAERKDEAWEIQYLFTLQPRRLQDFAEMCHYHQTSPESSFTRRRVCTQATGQGRITLSDRRLIITANGHRQEQPILDAAAFAHALQTYFAIRLQARATPAWNSPSNLD